MAASPSPRWPQDGRLRRAADAYTAATAAARDRRRERRRERAAVTAIDRALDSLEEAMSGGRPDSLRERCTLLLWLERRTSMCAPSAAWRAGSLFELHEAILDWQEVFLPAHDSPYARVA